VGKSKARNSLSWNFFFLRKKIERNPFHYYYSFFIIIILFQEDSLKRFFKLNYTEKKKKKNTRAIGIVLKSNFPENTKTGGKAFNINYEPIIPMSNFIGHSDLEQVKTHWC
jgi:hypothetical protein